MNNNYHIIRVEHGPELVARSTVAYVDISSKCESRVDGLQMYNCPSEDDHIVVGKLS